MLLVNGRLIFIHFVLPVTRSQIHSFGFWQARCTLYGMRVVTSSSNRITLSLDCDDMVSTTVTIPHDRLLLDLTFSFMIVVGHISLMT